LPELFDVSCAVFIHYLVTENQSFLAVSPNFLVAWKPYKTQ